MTDVKISIELQTPKPANFLRASNLRHGDQGGLVDVADLPDETLDAMGEAIKRAFIDNAISRRKETQDG